MPTSSKLLLNHLNSCTKMDPQNITTTSGSGPSNNFFQNAHNFHIIRPTITSIGRDQINTFSPSVGFEISSNSAAL
ncbi:hypothetical protein GYMLUDRAFT_243166 [Collybiopsis luxurians FD-317 M1]|uniref:Uncharacterized protein n=1 Tax=Collybiopsis luxurians FD-317 M1 TaxID=944289 RepID=A0A0D0CS20_9AGAR|nr:hypothetical protein GYMLUDRAFT_243166 [Collybiopsis luxurians FD-317 M1]